MKRHAARALFAAVTTASALLVFAPVAPLSAQSLEAGTWAGTVEPPEGGVQEVEFVIETGDELSISMQVPGASLYFENASVEDGVLRFSWNQGMLISCELMEGEDGGYAGECVGDDGSTGYMTMTPPKD